MLPRFFLVLRSRRAACDDSNGTSTGNVAQPVILRP